MQLAVVARSVAAIMVPTVAAEAAAAWAVTAEAEVPEEGVFGEVVAVVNGTVGRFRSEVTFPTRWPQLSWGGVKHEPDAKETAAQRFNQFDLGISWSKAVSNEAHSEQEFDR